MKFILFTGALWLTAMFHVWEHRCFERDLRRRIDGVNGDWRTVTPPLGAGGEAIKRAFRPDGRRDVLRYAGPVLIFIFWLIFFHSWGIAALYAVIITVKWFAVTTILDRASARYALYLGPYNIFSASL